MAPAGPPASRPGAEQARSAQSEEAEQGQQPATSTERERERNENTRNEKNPKEQELEGAGKRTPLEESLYERLPGWQASRVVRRHAAQQRCQRGRLDRLRLLAAQRVNLLLDRSALCGGSSIL